MYFMRGMPPFIKDIVVFVYRYCQADIKWLLHSSFFAWDMSIKTAGVGDWKACLILWICYWMDILF